MLLCQWGAASPECRLSGAGGEPDGWGVPSHFYLAPQLPVQRVAGSGFSAAPFSTTPRLSAYLVGLRQAPYAFLQAIHAAR